MDFDKFDVGLREQVEAAAKMLEGKGQRGRAKKLESEGQRGRAKKLEGEGQRGSGVEQRRACQAGGQKGSGRRRSPTRRSGTDPPVDIKFPGSVLMVSTLRAP